MKIRMVEPTPAAKPDVPLVAGGVYRNGPYVWYVIRIDARNASGYVFTSIGADGSSSVADGVSYTVQNEKTARNIVQSYVHVPDAELVIPRCADDK